MFNSKQHKYLYFVVILYMAGIASCRVSHAKPDVVIDGQIDHYPKDSIFIAQANEWNKPLAWAVVKKGHFTFELTKDFLKEHNLFLASVGYFEKGRIRLFDFWNDVLTTPTQAYLYNTFVIDTSYIKISGDLTPKTYMKVQAGQECRAFYRTQMMRFGYLEHGKGGQSQLDNYISIIKEYPRSQYLLNEIYSNKSIATTAELHALLNSFEPHTLQSALGKSLVDYVNSRKAIQTFPNFTLESPEGKGITLIDSSAAVNVVVVWASWCGPCRKEIPGLKKIFDKYSHNIRLISVSIDEDKNSWQTALKVESMPWAQAFVPDLTKLSFKQSFEIGSIPDILLLNGKGELKARLLGYSDNEYQLLEEAIEKCRTNK